MKSLVYAFLFYAVCITTAANAQTEALKVEPDSPDFTVGTSIVPQGHFQIESRFTAQRRGPMHQYGLGESLIRYGVNKHAEIRINTPSYLLSHENGRETGFDDSSIEAKFNLYSGKKAEYGLYLDSLLPTGSRRVAERKYQPSFRLTSNFKLSEKLELTANLGARRASMDHERFSKFIAAASLQFDAAENTQIYSEVYGFNRLQEGGSSQKFLAAGVIQTLGQRTALDVRVGTGFNNDVSGPDYFYEFGLAHLF